jgi:hypothetical protein
MGRSPECGRHSEEGEELSLGRLAAWQRRKTN